MKKLFLILLLLPFRLIGQTIVNDYYSVTALAGNIATVTSINGTQGIHTLAVGDSVLIIQMQGAAIDQTNTASFGNATVNNAGNFEINVICAVSGNQVAFKFAFVNSYTPGVGNVQIVSHGNGQLATYSTPAGGVTGQPWNGTTGGVVFIKATSIIFSGPGVAVTANGIGFRGGASGGIPGAPATVCNQNVVTNPGGAFLWNNSGCNGASSNTGSTDYFYPKLSMSIPAPTHLSPPDPAAAPANLLQQYMGGWKGEGIAAYVTDMETGRGKQANGGGGGQTHNSGGAGGGLYGTGGSGGNQWNGATPSPLANGGVGGASISPSAVKLYMGGGGGGGHANYPNGNASAGGNGGGIILFRGVTITTPVPNAFNVLANGISNVPKLSNDSEGGGGAGGSIYFDVNTITFGASAVVFSVMGGNGGNSTNSGDCIGPGGGGGGGYILSRAVIPGTVNIKVTGGTNGITTAVTSGPCLGAAPTNAWGATAGTNGLSQGGQAAFATPLGTVPVSCSLPVQMTSFNITVLTDKVSLTWTTATEKNNDYFTVEKSLDGFHFTDIARIKGAGNSLADESYSYTDNNPGDGSVYYRIKQVDFDGNYTYSETRSANIKTGFGILSVYPQPVNKSEKLNIKYLASQNSKAFIQVHDVLGKEIFSGAYPLQEGINFLSIDMNKLSPGIYLLILSSKDGAQSRKMVVE
jgi:hypothetical protein